MANKYYIISYKTVFLQGKGSQILNLSIKIPPPLNLAPHSNMQVQEQQETYVSHKDIATVLVHLKAWDKHDLITETKQSVLLYTSINFLHCTFTEIPTIKKGKFTELREAQENKVLNNTYITTETTNAAH